VGPLFADAGGFPVDKGTGDTGQVDVGLSPALTIGGGLAGYEPVEVCTEDVRETSQDVNIGGSVFGLQIRERPTSFIAQFLGEFSLGETRFLAQKTQSITEAQFFSHIFVFVVFYC